MPFPALWLLLRISVSLANLTSNHLLEHLKTFEVVSPPLRHCLTDDVFPHNVNYSFNAFGKLFHLELSQTTSMFSSDYRGHKTFDENGTIVSVEPFKNCYYHGVVAGDPTSHVAVSTCSGGLTGSVLGLSHEFYLEPLHNESIIGRNLLEMPRHAVYRMEDHTKPFTCGNVATSPLPYYHHHHHHHSHPHSHEHHDHQHEENEHEEHEHIHKEELSYFTNSSNRRRLQQFSPSQGSGVLPSWVEVMVINDQVRSQNINAPGATSTEDIVFQMDALYRRNTAFSPPIRLRLVAQDSWLTGNQFNYTITDKGEIDQTNLLRDLLIYRYDHLAELPPHDILMLFSGRSFIGSVSGLAFEQVMCTPTKSGAVCEITRTLGMNAAIAAHELGHTLGMSHDGTGNLCPVSGFIMASVLQIGSTPDKWSSCSVDAMSRFFTMFQPKCITTDPPKQGVGPADSCGDGFIGGSEQCDCGAADCSKIDPCCNGATCRFVPGADCSSQSACCTSKCKIVPSFQKLKCSDAKNSCQFARYCDGYSEQCPIAQFANVGTACSVAAIPPNVGMLEGKCYRGECWSGNLQCQQERFDSGCTSPNAALMLGTNTNADVECGTVWCITAASKICTLIAAADGPKYKNDGVPCSGGTKQCYQGKCTTSYLLPGATPPPGFVPPADQTINACLGESCSGHGLCVGNSGTCSCALGWTGRYCNLPSTPLTTATLPTQQRKAVPFFSLSIPPSVPTTAPPTVPPTLPPTNPPTPPPTLPTRPPSRPTRPPTVPPTAPPSPIFVPFSPPTGPPPTPALSAPTSPPSLLNIPFTVSPPTWTPFDSDSSPPSPSSPPSAPTSPPFNMPVALSSAPSLPPSSPPSSPPLSSPASLVATLPPSSLPPSSPPTSVWTLQPTPAAPSFFNLPPLPPMTPLAAPIRSDIVASKGKPFLFNTSQYFFSPSGEALLYSETGLPVGTGLRLDPVAGFIFGTPSDADAASSPIALIITVQNSGGSASLNAFLRVDTSQSPPRSLGLTPIITFDTEELNVNFADSFVDDNKDFLTFTIDGLPPGSGLKFSPRGVLRGTPNPIDVIAQPFRVTITADDGKGGTAEDNVLITIMSAAGASLPGGPSPPLLIPVQCLREGVLFQVSLDSYFPNSADCRFSASGLPPGTGIRFDVGNRVLYGVPTRFDSLAADANQGKVDVMIVAADKQGRTVQQRCPLAVASASSSSSKQPTCVATSNGATQVDAVVVNSPSQQARPQVTVQQQVPQALTQATPSRPSSPSQAPPPFITKLVPALPYFGQVSIRDDSVENTAPLAATIGKQSATVDFPFVLDVTPYFVDRERQPLTFTISGLSSSSGLSFDSTSGQLTGTPVSAAAGTSRITITASDPKGLSVNNAFDLVINDRYKAPSSASALTLSPASVLSPASSPTWPVIQWPQPPATAPTSSSSLYSPSTSPALSPSWPLPTSASPTPRSSSTGSLPAISWSSSPVATSPPTPSTIPRSSKDCQTLQWSTRGQSTICASALDAQSQCNIPAPFTSAVNACSKLGARLCTFQELTSGVAVSTTASCRSSSVWWTSRLCEGGVQVFNVNQEDSGISCRSASDQLGVVCCADSAASTAVSLVNQPTGIVPTAAPTAAGPPLNMNPLIQPRITTMGVFQYFPLAPSFGGSQLYFSLQGLPQGTGFQLDKGSGTLFGSASVADMLASPISMLIRASSAATGTYSQTNFLLTVLRNVTSIDPVASLIPSSSATVDKPFLLDISPFFTDPQRDTLTFTVSGLPDNTGFRFMSTTGIFFGAASQSDLRAPQPLSIRVSATNSRHGLAEQVLLLSILSADSDATSTNAMSSIKSRAFAPASAIVGQPFFVDLSQHFTPAPGDYLAFSVQGLPTTTGFVVDPQAGVLYGSALNFDLLTPQPITLRILADNKKGDSADQSMYLTIVAGSQQGCGDLNWRAFDSLPDVCASSVVKPDGTCATPTSYRVAENMCRAKNARLCTSDELMADTSNDPSCAIDNARIWSSTLCPDGTVYTQAGSALFITSFLPVCTSKSAQNAFKCCADKQAAGSGIKNVAVAAQAIEASDFLLDLSTYFTPPKSSSSLVYSLNPPFSANSGLSISSKGRITGRPTKSDIAAVSGSPMLVTVIDGQGWSISLQVTITISPQVNQPPVVSGSLDPKVANVGAQVYFPLASFFSDPDQDQLSFSLSNMAAGSGFGIDPTSGAVFGVPTMRDLGVQYLNVSAFDGKGGTCSAILMVTVTQNSPPLSVSSIPRTVANRGQLYTCRLANYFVDPDKDPLTYAITTGLPVGTGLTLDPNTGILSGSPSLSDVQAIQPLTVRIQVSDGRGGNAFENIVILARDNQNPVGQTIPIASGKERVAMFLSLSNYFQDPDGDALTYSIIGLPKGSGLLLDTHSGVLAGLPTSIDAGPVQPMNLSVSVDDHRGGTATQSMQLVILNSQGTNAPIGIAAPPGGWGTPQRTSSSPALLRDSTRDIILGTLPSVDTMAGKPIFQMLSVSFTEFPANKKGIFTQIQGLPAGTGLGLSAEGILSGVPSSADQNAHQPLQLTITAMDTTNTTEVRKTLSLNIISSRIPSAAPRTIQPTPFVVETRSASAGKDAPTVVQFDAVVGNSLMTQVSTPGQFQKAISQYKNLATVQSRQVGLPLGSGMSLDAASGTLSGIPNAIDLKASGIYGIALNVTFLLQTPLGTQTVQVPVVINVRASSPLQSVRSCADLGWKSYEMLGVCANSQLKGCTGLMSYSAAINLCNSAGARLCTVKELENDAAKGSGCDLEQQRVWSADQCDGGEVTTGGSMASNLKRLCSNSSERYSARCCADEDWGLLTRDFTFADDDSDNSASPTPQRSKTVSKVKSG